VKTDLTLLRALLDAGLKRISGSEERAFRGMLRDLESGMLVKLSKPQRIWVEGKYNTLDLGRAYIDKAPPKVKVALRPSGSESIWDKPKATKPPGR
jgi:hypothetical protein